MTNLFTQDQVFDLCRQAGFTRKNSRIGSAIAMCESAALENGEPRADADRIGDQELADDTWGFSYGLFQIRSMKAQWGTGGIRDGSRLLDPLYNAKSARAIKLAQGWRAWTVFQTGAYKAYMQEEFPPAPNTYIVVSGDTLSKIAQKYGFVFTWQQLALVNNLHSPYTIYIGQVLLLPEIPA